MHFLYLQKILNNIISHWELLFIPRIRNGCNKSINEKYKQRENLDENVQRCQRVDIIKFVSCNRKDNVQNDQCHDQCQHERRKDRILNVQQEKCYANQHSEID